MAQASPEANMRVLTHNLVIPTKKLFSTLVITPRDPDTTVTTVLVVDIQNHVIIISHSKNAFLDLVLL